MTTTLVHIHTYHSTITLITPPMPNDSAAKWWAELYYTNMARMGRDYGRIRSMEVQQ